MNEYHSVAAVAVQVVAVGLLAAWAATPALAQTEASFGCGNEPAGTRPLPRILGFTVQGSGDSAPGTVATEATVIGGHAVRGIARVEVQLDAVLPEGCLIPLSVVSAEVNSAAAAISPTAIRSLANALDGVEFANGLLAVDPVTANRQRVVADGTGNVVRFELPIQGTNSRQPVRHALKLVMRQDYATARPFAITAQPLERYFLNAPRELATHGRNAVLQIFHPAPLLPETARFPVRVTLSSSALGTWRETIATRQVSPLEQTLTWDSRFNPIRAEAVLEPANVTAPVTGSVTYNWAGQEERVAITVNPSEGCQPVFTASAVPGGVQVRMANRLQGMCPAHVVTPSLPDRAVLQLAPASATIAVGAVRTVSSGKPVLAGSVPLTGGRLTVQQVPSSALFTINRLALIQLAVGTRYVFEIRAKTGPLHRVTYTVTAADRAVITGK